MDGDLRAQSNDLSLLSGTGPKRRSDQSQKGDEKGTHLGNDDDLTNGAKTRIFNPDGVFGIHRCSLCVNVYTLAKAATHPQRAPVVSIAVLRETRCKPPQPF
jgi:hypothetical protein